MSTAVSEEIVGRAEESASIERFLDSVRDGPEALVIEGEAGIGKTTLWQAGRRAACERSFHVLACRPTGAEATLSYAAIGDLLEPVLEEVLPDLPSPRRRALEVALLLEGGEGAQPEQRAIGLALLDVLRVLARTETVLVAVDDIQWLDAPSATVLKFALRRLEGEPVALLAALRLEESSRVQIDLDALPPEARLQRLRLAPLSVGALHRVLRSRLGTVFARPTLLRLHRASGGNPFFALEIARALERTGEEPVPGEPLPVPDDLSTLVRARLDGLSPAALSFVQIAAALADPTLPVVETAAQEQIEQAVEEAVAADVIQIEGERLRFSHPLLASAAYSRPTPREARDIHRRLAMVVADLEQRARHLALAAEGADDSVAAVLDKAAEHASHRGAPDAAAELAEQALRHTSSERPEEIRRRRLMLADDHVSAGNLPAARAILEQALADSPSGRQRAEILSELVGVRAELEGDRVGVELAREALAEAEGDERLQAEIALTLTWRRRSPNAAAAHARAAVEHAEKAGDPCLTASCLSKESHVLFLLGRGVQVEKMERALAHERACGHFPSVVAAPGSFLGFQLAWVGDLARSRALLEQDRDRARADGSALQLSQVLWFLAFLELLADEWERAAGCAEEAHDLAEQAGALHMLSAAAGTKAVVAAHLGLDDRARSDAEEAIETVATAERGFFAGLGYWALGHLELSRGNLPAAREQLGLATASYRAFGWEEPTVFRWFPLEVEALAGLGELDEAQALCDWIEERARRLDRAWALAAGHRGRGLLAAARGDRVGAFAAFERALAEHERVQQRFELAGTLRALGQTQRRFKQKRAARESLQSALGIYESLEARLWAEKTRGELARIGGRASASNELTPTEQRVAALVAQGQTNREVAAALFVTVRAVERNLSRIYRKLEIRSRTELAHRMASEGTAGPKP